MEDPIEIANSMLEKMGMRKALKRAWKHRWHFENLKMRKHKKFWMSVIQLLDGMKIEPRGDDDGALHLREAANHFGVCYDGSLQLDEDWEEEPKEVVTISAVEREARELLYRYGFDEALRKVQVMRTKVGRERFFLKAKHYSEVMRCMDKLKNEPMLDMAMLISQAERQEKELK